MGKAVNSQGRTARDSLEKIAIVVVHHDRTPQCNVSGYGLWDLRNHESRRRFSDPGIAIGMQGDEIFVRGAESGEREADGESEGRASHFCVLI